MGAAPLGQHLIAGHHADLHVVAHVAMVEPDSLIVRNHVNRERLSGSDVQHVDPVAAEDDRIALPMRRVEIQASPIIRTYQRTRSLRCMTGIGMLAY
jgi:hypothetical protein